MVPFLKKKKRPNFHEGSLSKSIARPPKSFLRPGGEKDTRRSSLLVAEFRLLWLAFFIFLPPFFFFFFWLSTLVKPRLFAYGAFWLVSYFVWHHFLVLAAKNEEDVFLCLQGLSHCCCCSGCCCCSYRCFGHLFFWWSLSERERRGEIPLSIVIYASFFPSSPLTYLDLSAPNVTRTRTHSHTYSKCVLVLEGVVVAVVVNLSLLLLFQPHICPLLCFRTGWCRFPLSFLDQGN